MKAITLWQPWASLIACGAKKYETRSWATSYRGPIAIHSALKDAHSIMLSLPYQTSTAVFAAFYAAFKIQSGALDKIPTGRIVATADLVGVYPIVGGADFAGEPGSGALIQKSEGLSLVTGDELTFGDWTPGRYAWELQNVVMLPEPIPAKGAQGLWNWEDTR